MEQDRIVANIEAEMERLKQDLLKREFDVEVSKIESEITSGQMAQCLNKLTPLSDSEMVDLDHAYDWIAGLDNTGDNPRIKERFAYAYNLITRIYIENQELKARCKDFIQILIRGSLLSGKKYRSLAGSGRDKYSAIAEQLENASK